jgi:hypothetical protein
MRSLLFGSLPGVYFSQLQVKYLHLCQMRLLSISCPYILRFIRLSGTSRDDLRLGFVSWGCRKVGLNVIVNVDQLHHRRLIIQCLSCTVLNLKFLFLHLSDIESLTWLCVHSLWIFDSLRLVFHEFNEVTNSNSKAICDPTFFYRQSVYSIKS